MGKREVVPCRFDLKFHAREISIGIIPAGLGVLKGVVCHPRDYIRCIYGQRHPGALITL